MEERFSATMILHGLGDTIGFKNGDWEFSYQKFPDYKNNLLDLRIVLELIFEFIDLGGVNGINLSGWTISDDTLFHMAIAKSLLKFSGILDKSESIKIKDNMIDIYNKIIDDEKNNIPRLMGDTTEHSISKWNDDSDERFLPYDKTSGGNGCAMRNLCIGLAFYGEHNRLKLIDFAITTSMFTHNHPFGFLGGLTSALFTAFAIENIPIQNWVFKLIDILHSDNVLKFINTQNDDIYFNYRSFIKYWNTYIDTRFNNGVPLKTHAHTNILFRTKYYYDNFSDNSFLGGSGISAMIMAYDSLLDCDGKWEKLIFYAILNPGDSDTVGAIAGGLYGAIYGFGDVPKHMFTHLEEHNNLHKLGKQLYDMYYLSTNLNNKSFSKKNKKNKKKI